MTTADSCNLYLSSFVLRKKRFQTHVVQWMSDPKLTSELRDTWMTYWGKVDQQLAKDLEKQLEEKVPAAKKMFAPAGPGESGPTGGSSK